MGREREPWEGEGAQSIQRVLDEGGRRKLLAPGGNLARNCLGMGAREAEQWQELSHTGGGSGVAGMRWEQLELEAWAP